MSLSDTPFDPAAAEMILQKLGVAYEMRPEDGRIVVPGSINLNSQQLHTLPDLRGVIVRKSFLCSNNFLKNLEGMPQEIGGSIYCMANSLTSLKGAPKNVFDDFHCGENLLTDLDGSPEYVEGSFFCNDNKLWTVDGSPPSVGCCFYARNNPLISLMGCPALFKEMKTDIGDYTNFDDITKEKLHHPAIVEYRNKKLAASLTFAIDAAEADKINSEPTPVIQRKVGGMKL
jgi:hypothetical protein